MSVRKARRHGPRPSQNIKRHWWPTIWWGDKSDSCPGADSGTGKQFLGFGQRDVLQGIRAMPPQVITAEYRETCCGETESITSENVMLIESITVGRPQCAGSIPFGPERRKGN